MEGLEDNPRFEDEMYEAESYTSSEGFDDLFPEICPSIRSYSSLDELYCEDLDEEDCRLVKLNNTIRKLAELINDPLKKRNATAICCLLCKLLKYNGKDGFYLKHLPQIGEILEFLSMHAKCVPKYLEFLYQLLELCPKPPLLLKSSEILNCCRDLKRYFSLLSYLLVLAPTKQAFLLTKEGIERLVGEDEVTRNDAVKPDVRREAVEASRLPVTLAELAEVASGETYPLVLQMLLAVADISHYCCFRILEAGVQNELLLRMHPEFTCDFKPEPVTDDTNLHLDKEDYHEPVESASQILWRLLTAIIFSDEVPVSVQCLDPPTEAAMWSLRAALRREVLHAGRSARSRKLRNQLANLLLASLMCGISGPKWELVESGIAEDLATLVVATEFGVIDTWAETATIIDADSDAGLTFKETLLLSVALLIECQLDSVNTLKNRGVISAILQLVNPKIADSKMAWNSEQYWHLFKYATYALTYLAPKIPQEFIENNGSLRLLEILERFLSDEYDDATFIASHTETICSLATSNCDSIIDDFRKYEFIPVLLKLVDRVLDFEALSSIYQKVIGSLLVIAENIMANQGHLQEREAEPTVKITVKLLDRCLNEKNEDSLHGQSFLIAIGSFIWMSIVPCSRALNDFLTQGGLYLILDTVENSNLPIQNLYLGVITDMCENTRCIHYLFTWRGSDKKKGLIPLLIRIWREEERTFGVERTAEGCIKNVDYPLLNDDKWMYLVYAESARHTRKMNTTTIGPVRPKIYHLRQLIIRDADWYKKNHYNDLIEQLSVEDKITMLTIDAYSDLKADEAMLEISEILDHTSISKSRTSLRLMSEKLSGLGTRIRDIQGELLQKRDMEDMCAECEEFQRIKDSKLNPAFDALTRLGYIGRTSVRSYLLAKCREQRTKAGENDERWNIDGAPIYRTYNFDANVTTVFNQKLKIQSTKPRKKSKICEVSLSSGGSRCSLIALSCSLATYKSDSSFLYNKFRFDPNENYALKSRKISLVQKY